MGTVVLLLVCDMASAGSRLHPKCIYRFNSDFMKENTSNCCEEFDSLKLAHGKKVLISNLCKLLLALSYFVCHYANWSANFKGVLNLQ